MQSRNHPTHSMELGLEIMRDEQKPDDAWLPRIWCAACKRWHTMPMPGDRKLYRDTKEDRTENGQESEQVSYDRSRTNGS
jgi:hypothetical protein